MTNKLTNAQKFLLASILILGARGPVKLPKKGSFNRRIIAHREAEGREVYLHATKGWRARRVAA